MLSSHITLPAFVALRQRKGMTGKASGNLCGKFLLSELHCTAPTVHAEWIARRSSESCPILLDIMKYVAVELVWLSMGYLSKDS